MNLLLVFQLGNLFAKPRSRGDEPAPEPLISHIAAKTPLTRG